MRESPESPRNEDSSSNDLTHPPTTDSSRPDLAHATETRPLQEANTDDTRQDTIALDREVAEAMAAMDPTDLAELTGDVGPNDAGKPGTMDHPGMVGEAGGELDVQSLQAGASLSGTVSGLSGDDVFLQFGSKSQGIVPRSQFGKKESLDVGRRVDVVFERYDADSDLLVVSRQGAIQRATWTNLTKGMLVQGRVTGVIKGGLEVVLKGVRAFMPASQVDLTNIKDVSVFLNQVVEAEVIDLDRRQKNVILSRRRVLEREQAKLREQLKTELETGQVRKGIVRRITDFGAFVDLGGIDGLLHISDLSWGAVDKVSDVVSEGQEIEVKVLKLNEKRDRISLGLKHVQPDPWLGIEQRYPVGTQVKVRVVRLAKFGAFAELEAGVQGLIPISEMGWSHVKSVSDVVSEGAVVDCVVIRLENDRRRLALSIKQAEDDPWAGVLDSFQQNSIAKGKVSRLADFGAFVELAPGIEGLIHISELSDKRVRTSGDVVQVGQEVETRVLGVDRDKRRISLSIKALTSPAHGGADATRAPNENEQKKPKRKRPLRGGLSSHFDW